ncbi:MAG: hypothetical protein K6E78_06210 [Treponema sp.]|nr:hypothetical protein [Treponema sp.]
MAEIFAKHELQNSKIKEDVSKIPDFQQALHHYFTSTLLHGKPILTEEEIKALILKLGGTLPEN